MLTQSSSIDAGREKIMKMIIEFRGSLCDLLGIIKLYYNYHSAAKKKLDIIIAKIEELILLLYSPIDDKTTQETCITKLLELFYLLLTIDLNTTFFDLFLKSFQKLLKKIKKNQNHFFSAYPAYFLEFYKTLLNKKLEFIGVQSDTNALLNTLQCLSLLVSLFYENDTNLQHIKGIELFHYFFTSNTKLFELTKSCYHIEKFSKITKKTFKTIFTSHIRLNEFESIFNLILDKIIRISKIKENSKNTLDNTEQDFYVDTLIICLKLSTNFLKKIENCELSYDTKLKLTKCLIELSFWDNPRIVNFTCKIFSLFWKAALKIKDFKMRNEIEVLFDFIYIRHLNEYYKVLSQSETAKTPIAYEDSNSEQKIKLAVIEIIARSLNTFLSEESNLPIFYLSTDAIQIRFKIVENISNSMQRYLDLSSDIFSYLKQTFLISYKIIFKIIQQKCSLITQAKEETQKLERYEKLSDKWNEIIKLINSENFKNLYKHLCSEFKMTFLDRNAKFETLSEEEKEIQKKVAKSIAILVRFSKKVDINALYETLGENFPLSKLILEEYLKTFSFKGLDIIEAYELYVSTFKLTGEQFHLYNFITQFSSRYFFDNKEFTKEDKFYFTSDEQVFTIAYSTMMLNTDLHNPNVQEHMSYEDFIKNNKKIPSLADFPDEYFKNIYDRILQCPLKAAQPRIGSYSKEEELYSDLKSRHLYIEEENLKDEDTNIIEKLYNSKEINEINFPYLNLCENFYCNPSIKEESEKFLVSAYEKIFEDLFCNVFTLPQSFFEQKSDSVLSLLTTICDISIAFNQKEKIDRIITTLSSMMKKTKNTNLYNLFFKISIQYSKEFHSNLEIYYQAIIDVISHKLKEEKNPLRIEYIKLIDEIIYKTYCVVKAKKDKKKEVNSIAGYFSFFSSVSQPENEFSYEDYKNKIYSKLEFDKVISTKENDLIDINEIIDIIKGEEEEFIFFVTLAASKILDFRDKKEFYISLIFLKEMLKGISQKNFIKIWQNLYNIFKSQMEFQKDSDDVLFDVLYSNFFLHQIISQYFVSIENEDYVQLLENYVEIDSTDILFIILENNDNLIQTANTMKKYINDRSFEILITLISKILQNLSEDLMKAMANTKNSPINSIVPKFVKCVNFLTNITNAIKDVSVLTIDNLVHIKKCIEIFYEINIVSILTKLNLDCKSICVFVKSLGDKMIGVLPDVNDDKWTLYIYLMQFCFKCSLVENEQAQMKFMELNIYLFEKSKIPLVRYKEIFIILTNWSLCFVSIKKKFEHFWDDVMKIFYFLFTNNEEIANSSSDLENLWGLFLKKYLISYVDEVKKNGSQVSESSKEDIKKIYDYVNNIVKNNLVNVGNEKVSWWETTKNTIKLYFPEIVSE